MPSEPFEYDQLRIRDFIADEIEEIKAFCFFLKNQWSKRYAYNRLSPGRLILQAQEIVQTATLNHEVGELVFYLCKYWLEDYSGSPRALVETEVAHQLKLYVKECQKRGNESRFREVQHLLSLTGAEVELAPKKLIDDTSANAVFVSYAWGGDSEKTVDQIEATLQKRGIKFVRDKRDLDYKGSIKEFMERIGQGNCVILVISDKYLRSPNCMFELVEIAENKQFVDRIFPIVLADADIYDPVKRLEYVKHWETKRTELAQALKTVDPANLQGIRDDMDLYDRIRDKVAGLASILKDMNTLTPEMHAASGFSTLIDAIEHRCGAAAHKGE
jgi:hypothetical protein